MSWPLSQDYNEAIQSPASNFADPDLRRGEAVANALGIPMPYSGNFADVYQVRCPDGTRWAVKCFTREAAGLRERYQEISQHLRQARLPFTVDFSYLEKGMRVAGQWYPVLKMQWVEGLTLNQFVSQHLDKPATLEALLHLWAKMAKYLRAAEVGHCDLQHGNVLLVPGVESNSLALKLIDYDGMWVPALAGKKSGEVGHPNYQHPQRLHEGTFSIEVDRFPLLLVATALRALKAKGNGLWEKYDNGDNLLFKEADMRDPKRSPLFQELVHSSEPATAALLAPLLKSIWGGLASAPLLQEVMSETNPALAPGRTPRSAPTSAPADAVRAAAAAPMVAAANADGQSPWDFDDSAPSGSIPSAARPEGARPRTNSVPVRAWAAAIALLVLGLGATGVALWILSGNPKPPQPETRVTQNDPAQRAIPSKDMTAPAKDQNLSPKDNSLPPKDDSPGDRDVQDPARPTKGVKDLVSIKKELDKAKSDYAAEMEKAKAVLLLRYNELQKAFEAGRNPQATKLKDEIRVFQSEGIFRGREELREGFLQYWHSLQNAKKILAIAYSEAITDYTMAKEPNKANELQAELTEMAVEAPVVSLESIGRPGQFIAHGGYLGCLTRANTTEDSINETFEMVPGLANRDLVSFRSINVPNYYLVHGDFRIRLQKHEDSDGYRRNGTFKQVKGLTAAGGASFESVNYPGFYIHARDDKLYLDKYDGSAGFQLQATFTITTPRFKLADLPANPGPETKKADVGFRAVLRSFVVQTP